MADITSANGVITTQNLVPAGVFTPGSAVEMDVAEASTLAIQTIGVYTGALSLQVCLDGQTWITLGSSILFRTTNGSFNATIASAVQDTYQLDVAAFTRVRITALAAVTGSVAVLLRGSAAPGPAISFTILGAPSSQTTTSIVKAEDAPHASGDAGIEMLGVRYETNNASPVSAAGDYGFIQIDDMGKVVVMPFAPPVNQQQAITAAMTLVASTAVFAAAGASIRNYVTNITLTNTHATQGTEIDILDGATILDRIYVPPLATISKIYDVPLKGTANTALNAQNVTTGSNTYVQATGFKSI